MGYLISRTFDDRKNVDIDVSFGRDGGKSTTMNDESSKTINSRCQYSDTLTQTNGKNMNRLDKYSGTNYNGEKSNVDKYSGPLFFM
jgi:hypothetical protein